MKVFKQRIILPSNLQIEVKRSAGEEKKDTRSSELEESLKLATSNMPEIDSLKLHLQAIQEAQRNLGLQSQAAMDPISDFFGGLSVGGKVALVLTGWAAAVFSHEIIKFVDEKIAKPLGSHWNDALFGAEEARNEAIKNLTQAKIENPKEVIQAAEFAFREYVIGSLQASGKELGDAQAKIARTRCE